MSKLNPRQAEAVKYIDGPLLVLAGAGSGKTSVITRKIAYLIEECGYPGHAIAAVTFTNKAAREMKERVGQLVDKKKLRGLMVCTFHTLGLTIIRRELKTLGYRPGFSIFDQSDALALLKELMMKDGDIDMDHVAMIQNMISNWKNELISPEKALSMAGSQGEQQIAIIYQSYNRALKAYNAFDFDDLILQPSLLFDEHSDILERWRAKLRYLLIDEYQDTNGAQYQLIQTLLGNRGGLTVVGDDDQSIYAWRGARPENIAQLSKDYPGLHVVKLEQNYRSTSRILKAANHLIDHNPHDFNKKLWSEMGYGDPIRVIRTANEDAECERVATEIMDQRLRTGGKYSDFAVLYRGNHQSRLLEMKLQQFQVPYVMSGGTSFFSRQEVKDALAYLRLLVNPTDDNAFLRIINVPRRKIGPSTLEKLAGIAVQREQSLFNTCGDAEALNHNFAPEAAKRLFDFHDWISGVRQRADDGDPIAAVKAMIDESDYENWLHQNASSPNVAEKRMGNVHSLVDQLKQTLGWLQEDDPDADLEAVINRLLLRDMLEQQEEEDDSDRVQLLTIHASKGLEYPNVFLLGWEEEILPHRSSIEEGSVEEERRLAYVAITRAKRNLTITLAAKRKQFGEWQSCQPSRFLDELPEEDIDKLGFGTDTEKAQNKERGRETLASLRDLLKK
ncbi:DNA helicase Rep [uncultured Umboniibacter sp.]|uniref:DNA helicase Rep n=1 Tax=uncultured Umboniibacter sp. TaxID=1798917 RepID=UPI00260595B9|nr:DNA helicase Rep [uncultured Umboniibacter sp.]